MLSDSYFSLGEVHCIKPIQFRVKMCQNSCHRKDAKRKHEDELI